MNAMRRKNRIQTPKIQASLLAGRLSLEWRQQPSQELQFPVPFASEWCHVITFLPVTTWLLIFTALLLWCCLITPVLHCLLLCHIIGWSPTKWQEETLWSCFVMIFIYPTPAGDGMTPGPVVPIGISHQGLTSLLAIVIGPGNSDLSQSSLAIFPGTRSQINQSGLLLVEGEVSLLNENKEASSTRKPLPDAHVYRE